MPSVYCFVFMYMLSFIMVMGSNDWFLVWMGLEINMMSFLVLVYRRYSISIIESCLKYFFIQSLGSALLISLFYLNYYLMGSLSVLVLSFKIGAGPFFYWFPSMCCGLNWMSCYILMLFQKMLPLLLISLFVHWMLWFVVVVSLVMGVLGSFNQINIKQLLAYSSIHHLGWIILVMMKYGLEWFMYLLLYGVVLFSVIILLMKEEIVNLSLMFSHKSKMVFVISMLSMAGMPPLLGFFLKWMALISIINMNMIFVFMLVLVSVIMLYIYIRMVYDIFMGGGVEMVIDFNMLNEYMNVEILSMMGIIMGTIMGIYINM